MSQNSSVNQSRFSRLRSVTGAALTTNVLTPRRMWLGLALTAIVIAAVGWTTERSLEHAVKTNLAEQLQVLLNAKLATLEIWFEERRVDARTMARMKRVREPIVQLSATAQQATPQHEELPALAFVRPGHTKVRHVMEFHVVQDAQHTGWKVDHRRSILLQIKKTDRVHRGSISCQPQRLRVHQVIPDTDFVARVCADARLPLPKCVHGHGPNGVDEHVDRARAIGNVSLLA